MTAITTRARSRVRCSAAWLAALFFAVLCGHSAAAAPTDTFAVVGATIHTMVGAAAPLDDGVLVVTRGAITCIGPRAQCPIPAGAVVHKAAGGVLLPGLVDIGTHAGLVEISLESGSGDGAVRKVVNAAHVRALDGVHMNSRLLDAARWGGVTTLVSRPLGHALLTGQSVAFNTRGTTIDDALIVPSVAVHTMLGAGARHAKTRAMQASTSGQFAELRRLLDDARALSKSKSNDPEIAKMRRDPGLRALVAVIELRQPLVIHAQRADTIIAALRLIAQTGIRAVIAGGAEAHVVATELARAKVPVLLAPVRARPYSFATLRARDDGAARLFVAGVQLALSTADDHLVRNLRWQAGWAVAGGLPHAEALRAITTNPARMLGLPAHVGTLAVGQPATFVVFDGDPLTLKSHVKLVAVRGVVERDPKQR